MTKCQTLLQAPIADKSRIKINQNSVSWNGHDVPAFRATRYQNELALLKFLVGNANHIFSSREIVRDIFPDRENESILSQKIFIKKLKYRLLYAFKDFPDFDAIQNQQGLGYYFAEPSIELEKVGNVRVTLDAVYWNNILVPGFGPKELENRRALLSLLDKVDQFVSVAEFADDVVEGTSAAEAERLSRAMSVFERVQKNFRLIDQNFRALDYKADVGVVWSEIYPKAKSENDAPPSLYFRGKKIKLERGALVVLEALLENAPNPVSRADIAFALPNEWVSYSIISVYISFIRAQVGAECVATKPGGYFQWVAPDRPEIRP